MNFRVALLRLKQKRVSRWAMKLQDCKIWQEPNLGRTWQCGCLKLRSKPIIAILYTLPGMVGKCVAIRWK
jgi:hypothetical protein